jgi:glutamate/tyrosine decarboxylase-like PLP-dependent enzyme
MSAWFAGPKGENAEWFAELLAQVTWDYYFWRRNYFPEDGVVVGAADRRQQDEFRDRFEDRLNELLGRLKADCPFHSPRYAGHMIAEQTLPSIAGYFAAMLYNPNNVAYESAPVTLQLELEAAAMISKMLGHGEGAWSHLTSGGTMANFEALWIARSVQYLPFIIDEIRSRRGEPATGAGLGASPRQTLAEFARLYRDHTISQDLLASPYNVAEYGVAAVESRVGSRGVILVPETHHYCFSKAMDLLGLGRAQLVRVRVDTDFRMDVADLDAQLDALEAKGQHALMVVAVVGATEEGAVDPVDKIIALRASREAACKRSFWLHADAAYGGYLRTVILPERIGLGEPWADVEVNGQAMRLPLQLPEHGACDALECLGECDSITVDPHKLGYVPYPAGVVSFRTRAVKPLARQQASYLEEHAARVQDDETSNQIGVFTLEGSKPGAAAAAVWLSHQVIALDARGHGALVQQTIRNACELHALLETYGDEEIRAVPLCAPGSNIVCYALRPRRESSLSEINLLNKALYERFSMASANRSVYEQRFFVSRTTLEPSRYATETVSDFLERLGVTPAEYEREGMFMLRSVLMNPWYGAAKARGRFVLSDLVAELHASARSMISAL